MRGRGGCFLYKSWICDLPEHKTKQTGVSQENDEVWLKVRSHSQWYVSIKLLKLLQTMFQIGCWKWHWVVGCDSCVTRKSRSLSARDDSNTTHLGPKQLTHLHLTGSPAIENFLIKLLISPPRGGIKELFFFLRKSKRARPPPPSIWMAKFFSVNRNFGLAETPP